MIENKSQIEEEIRMICPECEGVKGGYRLPEDYWMKCPLCGGRAVAETPKDEHWEECQRCNGTGEIGWLEWVWVKFRRFPWAVLYRNQCPECCGPVSPWKARRLKKCLQ